MLRDSAAEWGAKVTENAISPEAIRARFADAWRPLDPQVAFVLSVIYSRAIAQGIKPLNEMTPVEARRVTTLMQFYLGAGAPAIPHVEERTIHAASGRIRVRLYDPDTQAPAPAVVFLHGGGWVLCDIDIYDAVARQLAKRSGLRLVSVDYALAPEHPFPVPLDDCVAAVRWVLSDGAKEFGIDPARVAIAGDSAGANLALATCLKLRQSGAIPLRGAALIYGCYSADTDTPTCHAYGGGAYLISKPEMEWYWTNYAQTDAARRDPLAAPLLADLAGLPPLYVAASEYDVLRDDSETLAARATAAGIETELRVWKGMIHACVNLMGWIDAMGPEVDRIGAFLRRVTAAR
jgi:acetyl esterase